jgi:hypothetical protein
LEVRHCERALAYSPEIAGAAFIENKIMIKKNFFIIFPIPCVNNIYFRHMLRGKIRQYEKAKLIQLLYE